MIHTLTILTQLNEDEAISFSKQLRLASEILSEYENTKLSPQQYLNKIANSPNLPDYMFAASSDELLAIREVLTSTLN
jgi:hypothetical protein